jgi:hypothetical protein
MHAAAPPRRAPESPPKPVTPGPTRDPTADALPEDVVMPDDRDAQRQRGASKSRNRRRGRPR